MDEASVGCFSTLNLVPGAALSEQKSGGATDIIACGSTALSSPYFIFCVFAREVQRKISDWVHPDWGRHFGYGAVKNIRRKGREIFFPAD